MAAERLRAGPAGAELSSPETADRVLAHLMNISHNSLAIASIRDIEAACGIGRSTAQRALARLAAAGDLTVHRKGTGADYPTIWKVPAPLDPDAGDDE